MPTLVTDLVAHWVRRNPEHPAVIDTDDAVMSYADLWRASDELARQLPIADGEVVGVSMSRGAAAVTAMLSVLRAGGIYCPTRPDDPPDRTRRLQDRVGIRFVLYEDGPGAIGIEDRGGSGRVLDTQGDRPIYVMWTSGSTGEPKAVVIPHRGVIRLAHDRTLVALGHDDRVAFASNPMFDAATWEVWATLGNGATIVVVDQDELLDAARLRSRFERAGVTRAFLSTSLFDLHAGRDPSMFGGLRSLIVGGESLRPRTIGAVLTSNSPPGELVNGYGPTECTTFATSHPITLDDIGGARIPIGTPLLETMVAIVDEEGRAVPAGEEGELWIAGSGVALGYLGVDGLMHDRFVEAAVDDDPPRRWYCTGDLARFTDRGRLDLLGRIDRQVKIRGHRIEPIEIEQAITMCDGVAEVAVVADRSSPIVRLCAFVVGRSSDEDDSPELAGAIRSHLRATLPSYMVPSRITVVDRLPLTANGKLDMTALLARPAAGDSEVSTETHHAGARNPTVTAITEQARIVLTDPGLAPDDDLWDAGLDSLSAIELATAVSGILGRDVHPSEFVRHSTAASVAAGQHTEPAAGAVDVTVFAEESSSDPIFVVVGSGTSPLALRHLALQLASKGRPLVAIEPGGPRSDRRTRRRIESLAERVVTAIESRRPEGPLVIAGWSAGGVIAAHAATLLENQGRSVRLILFDTVFLTPRLSITFASAAAGHMGRLLRARLRRVISRSTHPREHLDNEARGGIGVKVASMGTLLRFGLPASIAGPVLHLHVVGSMTERSVTDAIPDTTSIAVPGDHISMFDSQYSVSLAESVDEWLSVHDPIHRDDQRRPTPS
jgi:amino acid adenylation domain-containing protein